MRFVCYYRVSTVRQEKSGLGLAAQRTEVGRYIASRGGDVLAEFVEIESGRNGSRPEIAKAIGLCRDSGATLVIAKLDRLSRDVTFINELLKGAVKFVACDMPEATEEVVGIMAVLAQAEVKRIRQRIVVALAEKKKQGVKLGNPLLVRGSEKAKEQALRASSCRVAKRLVSQAQEETVRMYAERYSYVEAAERLFENDIKSGDRPISVAMISRIVNRAS